MVRSSKILLSAVIMSMFLDIIQFETVQDLIQRNEILKMIENLLFLLVSRNKDSLCSCAQVFKATFYETTIIFLKFSEVLAVYFPWKQNHIDFN